MAIHMIVTRTRLCTRLVILLGYTPRHLLIVTVVLLVLYLYSYSCYRYSVAYIIMLFDYLISAAILVTVLCTLFICTSFSLYTHTHQVAFWWPWICTSRYWTLVLLCRCSIRWYALRGAGHSSFLILVLLHFLIPVIILWLWYIILTFYFISYFLWDSCIALICIIAVIVNYYGSDL